jgi:hypothetical protein
MCDSVEQVHGCHSITVEDQSGLRHRLYAPYCS